MSENLAYHAIKIKKCDRKIYFNIAKFRLFMDNKTNHFLTQYHITIINRV